MEQSMTVDCPGCGRRHNVGDDMAGRRAKCSCGTVIEIPLAANPVAQPFGSAMPTHPAPMPGQMPAWLGQQGMPSEALVCECRYGKLSTWLWLVISIAGIAGVWMIYTGIFDNKGWAINNAPLPPWGATIFFESFGWLGFGAFCFFLGGYLFQLSHPRRVAMTQSSLLLPKGTFSAEELIVPLVQASYRVEKQGSYSNLRIKHPGGTIRLLAVLFPSTAEFEHFLGQLSQRARTY